MKIFGLISTVVDWLVEKGVCAGGGGFCIAGMQVESATRAPTGVWKTARDFAAEGVIG